MPANYTVVYLQARRRARTAAPAFNSPLALAGLSLWLEASLGLSHIWDAAPASGSVWIDYSPSSGYTASGLTHALRVYAFKTVDGNRVYSAGYLELSVTDDSSSSYYFINWSWDAVAGAEGYRLLKSDPASGYAFDYSVDVFATESLVNVGAATFGGGGVTLLPQLTMEASAGDLVSQWADQSGLVNHARPTSPATQGTLQANVVNGRPVLRFGSASGYTTPLALDPPCTLFVVYAVTGEGVVARRAVQGSNNWLLGPYGPVHEFYNGVDFTGGPEPVSGVFVAQAAWQDGSTSRNFINGVVVGTTVGAGVGPGTVALGAGGAFAEPLDGDIAEVFAYDSALSDTDLARVWNYLAAKYALS